ncbi:uncharacterized protein LOC128555566 [Mercenaria mercenaria]|uniref:uncharacterized protein LOC128555566 n=1 Tax=Mercenaria mercenaria TaxID=6596 RepID=UPI00234EBF15|nr:uncharacterized protein LOC128555566 [Mercenaria mercenaria]
MDFNSKFLLLFALVVLVMYTDGAVTTAATASASNTTATGANDTDAALTSSAPAAPSTTKPKAPIQCDVGTCVGDEQCKNTTYSSTTCSTGICVTIKTVTGGISTYHFNCSSVDCAADQAPTGANVFCCEKPNCNTYESFPSSAKRLYSSSSAILTMILLISFV